MTQDLLERTVRDWVRAKPERGARTLDRFVGAAILKAGQKTTEEVTEALIQLAGRMKVAESRVW